MNLPSHTRVNYTRKHTYLHMYMKAHIPVYVYKSTHTSIHESLYIGLWWKVASGTIKEGSFLTVFTPFIQGGVSETRTFKNKDIQEEIILQAKHLQFP